MSGVAVICHLLANAAAVTARVPADRVFHGDAPLRAALPALSVKQISGTPRNTLAMVEPGRLMAERVQVTVNAKTYDDQKAILALAIAACPNQRGTVNGVALESILPDQQGGDDFDQDAAIYAQTQDFIVRWRA